MNGIPPIVVTLFWVVIGLILFAVLLNVLLGLGGSTC